MHAILHIKLVEILVQSYNLNQNMFHNNYIIAFLNIDN
jgi:hypothetical protein